MLDLQTPAGRDALRRLARGADVLIENYRPGVMARLGLDYATLAAENPRLDLRVDLGIRPDRPGRRRSGGFDLVAQGVSGIMSVTGEPGRPPVKAGVPLTDLGAGLFALSAILAALHWRTTSGRGQYIDTSLLEAGLALSVWEATEFFSGGTPQAARLGASHERAVSGVSLPRRLHHDRRGQRSHVRQARVAARPRRVGGRSALRHRRASCRASRGARGAIEAVTSTRTRAASGCSCLDDAGIPCGPINSYAEVFADPQVVAREMAVSVEHPTLGPLPTLGTPIKMSATPLDPRRRAPLLGEHTEQVLRDFGFTEAEILQLRR